MAMTLVETITVGSGGAASITFSNIPQTGKDLLLLISLRSNAAFAVAFSRVQVNSNSGSGIFLRGSGSAATTGTFSDAILAEGAGDEATANTFGNSSVYIANYTSTSAKSVSVDFTSENNATLIRQGLNAATTTSTAAVTSLLVEDVGDTLLQHTSVSLYIIS